MLTKLKAFGGLIKIALIFILTLGIYKAGKKSEQLDQREADLEQAKINAEAAAEGEQQFNEDVKNEVDNAGTYKPLSERMRDD